MLKILEIIVIIAFLLSTALYLMQEPNSKNKSTIFIVTIALGALEAMLTIANLIG